MSNILEEIVAAKQRDTDLLKALRPISELEKSPLFDRQVYSMKESLLAKEYGIIAEFKRRSPSKGLINGEAQPAEVATGYVAAGATGVSVLTNRQYFGGTNEDLMAVRQAIQAPILRKDFTTEPYHLYEAKAIGADAILLIAAALEASVLKSLAQKAKDLGLEVLLEVHNLAELEATLCDQVDLVGVNNRNLKDFTVSLETSLHLAEHIPSSFAKISESGLNQPQSLVMLKNYGYQGFLIGENFMKTSDPGAACQKFMGQLAK